MKLVILKRGGAGGDVAINVDLVTHVRSSTGPFTDVHFGEDFVTVEGSFRQVVDLLSDRARPEPTPITKWAPMHPPAAARGR